MTWFRTVPHLILTHGLLLGISSADDYSVEELSQTHHSIAMKLAVEEDNTDVLKGVIDHFANVKKVPIEELCTSQTNVYHYADYHPMHYACLLDRDEHLRHLVTAGCDKNLEAPTGVTPMHAAAEEGNTKSIAMLLELGADPKKVAFEQIVRNNDSPHRGFDGMTSATLAADHDKLEVLKIFKEFGGAAAEALQQRDLNGKKDEKGWTPLHYAVSKGHRNMYQYLIFEVGWGNLSKAEIVDAAASGERKLVSELAQLSASALEERRVKWLVDEANRLGNDLSGSARCWQLPPLAPSSA